LENKQYCIFNKPYTRETYFEKIAEITFQEVREFAKEAQRENSIIRSENCFGRDLTDAKNCILCYNGSASEDCKYSLNIPGLKESYDCSAFGFGTHFSLENIAGEENYHTGFNFHIVQAKDTWYSMYCVQNVSHCFGCI
jgi:hypothetical protein